MKIVIRILLLVSLAAITSVVNAQTIRKRITSDLVFGMNFAQMDIQGANMYKKTKLGMVIGANINFKILHNIQIQSGLYVTKRGLKQHVEAVDYNPNTEVAYKIDTLRNTAADYLQVPLCLGYEVYLTKNFAVNFNAGGYVAYGFKGKNRGEAYAQTIQNGVVTGNSTLIDPYENDTFDLRRWNRWDYGALARVGLIYDIYTINLTYEYGLHNVADDGRNLKNRNISLTLGFRF